jgi:hypothetical protein
VGNDPGEGITERRAEGFFVKRFYDWLLIYDNLKMFHSECQFTGGQPAVPVRCSFGKVEKNPGDEKPDGQIFFFACPQQT